VEKCSPFIIAEGDGCSIFFWTLLGRGWNFRVFGVSSFGALDVSALGKV
jgi:hypothetical protein